MSVYSLFVEWGVEMIEVNNLSKSFSNKQVLEDINVAFEKGEIVGLIGPSGT